MEPTESESDVSWAALVPEIRGVIAEVAKVQVDRVTDDAEFIADLYMDSITALELIVEIERRCNVQVGQHNFTTSGTVGGLLVSIKRSLELEFD